MVMVPRFLVVGVILLGSSSVGFGQKEDPLQKYRNAAQSGGEVEKGEKLFRGEKTACATCHTVDGKGGKVGPDLYAAGDKFGRKDLVTAVLEPSASIMTGYATTVLTKRGGDSVVGVLKETTDAEFVLVNAANEGLRVKRSEVVKQETSKVSLMPPGLHASLSTGEFRDLIAYLSSLHQPELKVANEKGTPQEIAKAKKAISVTPFFEFDPTFHKPVWFGEHPAIDGAYLLLEKSKGTIWLLEKKDGKSLRSEFVNVLDEIYVANDEGLLGFAYHPKFAENGRYFYMHETMDGKQRGMAISERVARKDRRADSGKAARVVLSFNIDTLFHHGGGLEFGPDGFLYIGMGDGGPQEDPDGHAQDLSRLDGTLMRIDVDKHEGDLGYAIPESNPFAGDKSGEVRREIFAYGLRQPWRFSFDPANGDLWVGDVGQNRFEEVCIVKAGENHGWNIFEGFELFSTQYRKEKATYVRPVVSFLRKHGVSITGGYVYRADPKSSFNGVYICGDYQSKRIWGVTQKEGKLDKILEIGTCPDRIVSFGQDREGELYIVGYEKGVIYKLDLSTGSFE